MWLPRPSLLRGFNSIIIDRSQTRTPIKRQGRHGGGSRTPRGPWSLMAQPNRIEGVGAQDLGTGYQGLRNCGLGLKQLES